MNLFGKMRKNGGGINEKELSGSHVCCVFSYINMDHCFQDEFFAEELGHIRSLNLIPLKGSVIVNGKLDAGEILQNVIAFIPLGVFIRALAGKEIYHGRLLQQL